MRVEGVQRTLIVGLGERGAQVVDRLLARLEERLGPVGVVGGVAVREEGASHPALADGVGATLSISPAASLGAWQNDLEGMVAGALRRISRLTHLTDLAARGLALHPADEVHLILVADLGQPWVVASLGDVAGSLRDVVYRILSCGAGLTGVLLDAGSGAPPNSSEAEGGRVQQPGVGAEAGEDEDNLPGDSLQGLPNVALPGLDSQVEFDRGCFLVSLTNEAGLVVGDVDRLVARVAYFLTLLVTSPLGAAVTESGWDEGWEATPLAGFGLATIRWPGEALARALSMRWAREMLTWLTAPILKIEEEASTAAQRWVAGERWAPPLLIESLADRMPPLPDHLADEVPDPPWPWQLVGVQKRLETAIRRWEEEWLGARGVLRPVLSEMREKWQVAAAGWLNREIEGQGEGALTRAKVYPAALLRLLEAFAEGVEAQLEEAEADLVAIDRQVGAAAGSLASQVDSFPGSPLATLLRWGLRPLRWPRRWAGCRQAQAAARRYAHLLRARAIALQTVWLYEEVLPLYRDLAAEWKRTAEAWHRCASQVGRASQSPALASWGEGVDAALIASGGPWTLSTVEGLYREALAAEDLDLQVAWERLGPLGRWVQEGLAADEIARRLSNYAADALAPWIVLPVDRALARQFPDEATLGDWLAAFVAQADPFLRYEETELAEETRSQARLDLWLLLPEGGASPLARLCQTWPRPSVLLESQEPAELVAVSVRRGLPLSTLSTPGAGRTRGDWRSDEQGIGESEDRPMTFDI